MQGTKEEWARYMSDYMKVQRPLKRARMNAIKLEQGCVDCGYNADPRALDFDHRDPAEKSFGLGMSKVCAMRWERVEAEIAKCDVRCSNCHRIRTAENNHTQLWREGA
jgi:hypothetical protein